MADGKVYVAQAGFIQFDPNTRDNNGQKLVDFTIKCIGKPLNIRVTLWGELSHAEVKKGDFIAVEGTFQQSTWQDDEGTKRTSNQINAYNLNVNGQRIERNERERAVSEGDSSGGDDLPF